MRGQKLTSARGSAKVGQQVELIVRGYKVKTLGISKFTKGRPKKGPKQSSEKVTADKGITDWLGGKVKWRRLVVEPNTGGNSVVKEQPTTAD